MREYFGFLNIDKPLGFTSHDMVARVRRLLREDGAPKSVKVGHAGTLDPLATGVLIVGVGAATRLTEYVMDSTKRYTARVRLGETSETYDAEGEITPVRDASHLTRADVEAVLGQFTGDIAQFPPMYSAVKQGGRKLYELARKGETVERKARPVRIDALTLADWDAPEFTLEVVCSAGTYIRSLAHDIGEALGVGAYLAGLVRTGSGGFRLADAVAWDTLNMADDWTEYLIMPEVALSDWQTVTLDAETLDHIAHGRSISGAEDVAAGSLARGVTGDGRFVAVLRADSERWHPYKVFLS